MSLISRLKKVLKTRPYNFQIKGIRFLKRTHGRALIGDDMGLGKTIQVLGWLAVNPNKRPVIIIAPSNAKYNWAEQIKKHTYMNFQILSGRKTKTIKKPLIIINYDILSAWKNELLKMNPCVIIIDECHMVKNNAAQRTKACKEISRKAKYVIPMSGTPIVNRPVEFFPVLNMIQPEVFSSFWKFAFRYCNPKRGWRGKGWDFKGASHLDELRTLIMPYFIRRMKTEVLTELPKKQRTILPIDIDNKSEYHKATVSFLQWYRSKEGSKKAERAKKAQALVKLGQLKQLTARGKLKQAYEWIDNFLFSTDEKLVVYSYHQEIFQALIKKYQKISAVGGKSGPRRQEEINKFQSDRRCRLFLGTIKADKEAITLTAARSTLFIEIGWTPSEQDQAEDRTNRISQKYNKVNIYYLFGRNTIDEYVWKVIEKKRKVIDQIIDGKIKKDYTLDVSKFVRLLERKKDEWKNQNEKGKL